MTKKVTLLSPSEEKRLNNHNTTLQLGTILRRIADATGDADFAKTPLGEMADTGYESMADDSGYILHEMKLAVRKLTEAIEAKAGKTELQSVWKSAERLFADKETFNQLVRHVEDLAEQSPQIEELRTALNILAADQDLHKIYKSDTTITSAQLLTMSATPIEVVTSPGPGKYIDVVHVELLLDYNSAAYVVDAGEDLSLKYETAGEIQKFTSAGFLDQASSQRRAGGPKATDLPTGVDEAVLLQMLIGEVTAGDSDLKVRIDYRILDSI